MIIFTHYTFTINMLQYCCRIMLQMTIFRLLEFFMSNNSWKSELVFCPQISVFAPEINFLYLRSGLEDCMSRYKKDGA